MAADCNSATVNDTPQVQILPLPRQIGDGSSVGYGVTLSDSNPLTDREIVCHLPAWWNR